MIRNLLYFCYPISGTALINNFNCLFANWGNFTGKKILFFAIDGNTLMQSDIIGLLRLNKVFEDKDLEFYFVPNNTKLRETAHFVRMLTELKKIGTPGSITFYAHSKGIDSIHKNEIPLKLWMQSMWTYNMRINEVEIALSGKNLFAGCFRYTKPYTDIKQAWHYSGTYFWFKWDIYKTAFTRIQLNRHGSESWPATICPIIQSYALSKDNPGDLYNIETWNKKEY